MSTAIFDCLPGVETPVADVRHSLAAVWENDAVPGKQAPSEFRASQMNLVIHLGLDSTPATAREAFNTALQFSRRYPCRTIFLCPRAPGGGGDVRAKISCECYVGASRAEMTCSEAIMLTYPLEERERLEDQASIMLESDLPIYYWPQRINSASRLVDYKFFLRESERVVIDSAIEKPEVPIFAWPRPEIVHDLVYARILPVRQSAGHFLSYINPAQLVTGLEQVELVHRPEFAAEGKALLGWMQRGAIDCAVQSKQPPPPAKFVCRPDPGLEASLSAVWGYAGGGRLSFAFDFPRATASLAAKLEAERNVVTATGRLLAPEAALAEALFF